MDIKQAKNEIANALRAYQLRDETGRPLFPAVRQRPILLMGPPGVGKTAILEQVAQECGVGLVSYTITHHTRQSAIGLPHIESRTFAGRTMDITEYTMSEIIASVYECMERTGKQEGILFVDEINCVSETLAPTMLQFLQNKTFGAHRVPEGWIIVAAGNPPQYNRSVREFDVVTLDRVRRIDVEPSCPVWMEYAWSRGLHGAILSYLSIRPEDFYLVEETQEGKVFVTARGWEDLSALLLAYEVLSLPVEEAQVRQYLQKPEIARSFASYLRLYQKYGEDYGIPALLDGSMSSAGRAQRLQMAQAAPMDERLTVVGLFLSALHTALTGYSRLDRDAAALHEALTAVRDGMALPEIIARRRTALAVDRSRQLRPAEALEAAGRLLERLEEMESRLEQEHLWEAGPRMELLRTFFAEDTARRQAAAGSLKLQLNRAFSFLEDCFSDGPEMIRFVTGLTQNPAAVAFLRQHGCPAYFRHSQALLLHDRDAALRQACRALEPDTAPASSAP